MSMSGVYAYMTTDVYAHTPPPRVQRRIKSSKNTVRTGVFVGHAVRYRINSVPKPGAQLIGSQKNTVRTAVFVGQGIRWTRDGGGGYTYTSDVQRRAGGQRLRAYLEVEGPDRGALTAHASALDGPVRRLWGEGTGGAGAGPVEHLAAAEVRRATVGVHRLRRHSARGKGMQTVTVAQVGHKKNGDRTCHGPGAGGGTQVRKRGGGRDI